MMHRTAVMFAAFSAVLVLGLVATGCGGSSPTTTLAATATTTAAATTTTTAAAAPTTASSTSTTAAPVSGGSTSVTDSISIITDTPGSTGTTEGVQITPSTEPTVTTQAARPQLSAKAIAYAKSLGGASYNGEGLYLIIGASKSSEAEAQALLNKALPAFGDMQPYFIIQLSDNFSGLKPGYFVIVEAHLNQPNEEDLQFARRGFPDAYTKFVTVNTGDPIPAYEDVMGIAEGE
jgi:hypothetical protein